MSFMCPREGELQVLKDQLGGGVLENWILDLFKSNTTPSETDSLATYTLVTAGADGSWYASKTLTRSLSSATWNTPVSQAPTGWVPSVSGGAHTQVAHSAYGSAAQNWIKNNAGTLSVYGYTISGATSGKLIAAEAFPVRNLNNADSISLTPIFELA
jgi:hypothetical protein